MVWTFLDFVGPDGSNYIKAWIEGLPASVRVKVKAKFTTRLQNLAGISLLGSTPYVTPLTGECSGLVEIKFEVMNVQYRPLAFYGPAREEITILIGAEERGGKLVPSTACEIAIERRGQVLADRTCVCPHDFS